MTSQDRAVGVEAWDVEWAADIAGEARTHAADRVHDMVRVALNQRHQRLELIEDSLLLGRQHALDPVLTRRLPADQTAQQLRQPNTQRR